MGYQASAAVRVSCSATPGHWLKTLEQAPAPLAEQPGTTLRTGKNLSRVGGLHTRMRMSELLWRP